MTRPTLTPSRATALSLAIGGALLARAVVGPLVGPLRDELWMNDQALGSLLAAFAAAYALALPAAAALAERLPRPRLLAAALLACAGGTAATALGTGFWSLAAARALAGLGAGATTALAGGLLRDAAHADARTGGDAALASHGAGLAAAAATVGLSLGYALGGLAPTWRLATAWAGLGVGATALLAWRSPDAPRSPDAWGALRATGWRRSFSDACGHVTGGLVVAAAAAGAFGAGGLAFWLPAFLERARAVPRHAAGVELAALVLMAGAAGAPLAAALAARLARRCASPNSVVAALSAAGAAAASLFAFGAIEPAAYLPALAVALLCVVTWVRAVVAAFERGAAGAAPAAVAVGALAAHGLGDLLGAPALGAVSDGRSFAEALRLLPLSLLASALLWALAALSRARRRPADAAPDEAEREVA